MKIIQILIILFCFIACQEKKEYVAEHLNKKTEAITSHKKMLFVKGGTYQPFYGRKDTLVKVDAFLIDETPVTNVEFLEFLRKNPQWRKSNVKRIYADTNYLKNWVSDLELPKNANPQSPICDVSWFAAKAYAKSVNKRLPTLDEWEFVAMADETDKNATKKPSYSAHIINLYNQKNKQTNPIKQSKPNAYGIYNMFDSVWEWTEDFNSILTTGDSRNSVFDNKQLNCAGAAISANDIYNYAAFMRFAFRTSIQANYCVKNLGFRCAKDTLISKK